MSASDQLGPPAGGVPAPGVDRALAKRGIDTAMQRSLLPMALALAANYGVAVVFHALSWPQPAAIALVSVTAVTVVIFGASAIWFWLRLPAAHHASTLGGIFAFLVISNVTLHYWLTRNPLYTAQFIVVVIVAGAVILSRAWMTLIVVLLLSAWAVASSTFFVAANWVEFGGYLGASTALAWGLNVARRRMVTRLEAARHTAEVGQEALRRAESDLREIIEKAPDGVLIHRAGTILYANPAIATHLRVASPEALVGSDVGSLVHLEDRAAAESLRGSGTSDGDHGTHGFVRADGEQVMLEISSTREIHFKGGPAVLITARDVTARHEEMQARLLIADRMAAVGTVAAGVAHEINNPLAFVIDNLAAMANDVGEPPAKQVDGADETLAQLLADTRAGAERIRRIVRGLKTFSRASDGEVERLDVTALIKSAIQIARSEVRHRARLEEDYQQVPPVVGDGARLGQVILNLIINAAHAIDEGNVADNVISLSTSTGPEGDAVITVRDTGCGISPVHQGRIFDPFFTTKPVGVGTGLGLYLCHNVVVSELKGRISVESRAGEGTMFRIVLPAAEPDDVAPAGEEARPLMVKGEERPLDVLIIDDEPAIGRALGRILKEHRVTVVTSPVAALADLRHADYDVILCDVMMPEMTGSQVFAELAEMRPGMERRIAFMTGGAFSAAAATFLDGIDNPVLDKPMDHTVLRQVIRQVAGSAGSLQP